MKPVHKILLAGTSIVTATLSMPALSAPAADSAYLTDPQQSHVEDATSKGIGQVNMITCFMGNTGADKLVNQPSFAALLNKTKCDKNSQASASNSGASGGAGAAPEYMRAKVLSTRASNSDPMIARIWVEDSDESGSSTIFLKLAASEAPSPANPWGTFRLDYCGRALVNGQFLAACSMQGYLDAGASGLIYYESEIDHGNGGGKTQLALANNASADSGSGKLSIAQGDGHGGTQTDTFTFAYNDSYYLRSDTITNTPQCFSRKLSDAKTSVWRYGLYDSSGARADRNSGFQITFEDGGQVYQGNVGYFGLWLSDGKADTIADGALIKRQAFGGNQPAKDYTLVKTGGKLSKYIRQQTTLDKIQNVKLQVSLNDGTDQQPNWHQYEVYWDGSQFQKSGVMVCGNNGCTTSDASGAIANSFWAGRGGVFGFSQSLGGQFAIRDVAGLSNPASEVVTYRIQDVVYPGEAPAKLYCASDCFDSASLNGYFVAQSSQSPFMTGTANQESNIQGVAALVSYTPAVANGLLTRDGETTAAVLTDKQAYGNNPMFSNGVRTGKLVPNGSTLACAGNPQNYCASKAEDLDVYYVWETGPGAWNQFAAIKPADGSNCEGSTGAICKFEAPLNVTYHVPADSAQFGEYAGTTLILQYAGFGQLWGIPGKCFSAYTNQPTSCDQPNARYVPAFSIPMDAATGLVSDGTSNYLVKWLDREVRFGREPTLSNCQSAGFPALPTGIALPDGTAFHNPGDPATTDYIGAPPDITATPRVIDGVVKY